MTHSISSTDVALARRIEQGHVHSGITAGHGGAVEAIGGGWAIFRGVDLPLTQALGVGMNGPVSPQELDRLEAFFHSRQSPAVIDLCTLADPGVLCMIQQRGYVVREISNVLARFLDPAAEFPAAPAAVAIEPVPPGGMREWARIVVRGFMETGDPPEDHVAMMSETSPDVQAIVGMYRGVPGGAAALGVHVGMATFFGDATLAPARGHGLQLAMIRHRLQQAAALGCDLASATVLPGSTSHRNYERAGFQLVYARIMLSLALPKG